jgi:hypothetical protein
MFIITIIVLLTPSIPEYEDPCALEEDENIGPLDPRRFNSKPLTVLRDNPNPNIGIS